MFHGSRDCRTQTAAMSLRDLLIAHQSKSILAQQNYTQNTFDRELESLSSSGFERVPPIEIAPLELAEETLAERLIKFARRVNLQGLKKIRVIPLFLAPGVHVRSDIPTEIMTAKKQIDCQVTIELLPYLGKYLGISNLIAHQFDELSAATRILIAHGSKMQAAAQYYQTLGRQLDIDIAYWSSMPRFSQLIKTKIATGSKRIALLPYFLFPGRITTAIATEVAELQQEFPQVELLLGKPLGATPAIAELIAREV